jgi:hypothetical protein
MNDDLQVKLCILESVQEDLRQVESGGFWEFEFGGLAEGEKAKLEIRN